MQITHIYYYDLIIPCKIIFVQAFFQMFGNYQGLLKNFVRYMSLYELYMHLIEVLFF